MRDDEDMVVVVVVVVARKKRKKRRRMVVVVMMTVVVLRRMMMLQYPYHVHLYAGESSDCGGGVGGVEEGWVGQGGGKVCLCDYVCI